jgi:pimeloyl-ACP methyl ester carboxylesterase
VKANETTLVRLMIIWACLGLSPCAVAQSAQDKFMESDGVRIRYRVWGEGPTVILIHGFGESLENWERVGIVSGLSKHFRVAALDVRGHGRSDKPHDLKAYGPELSGDVARLVRHLGVAKAHIVGYSMGALIALDFGVMHQERALSVVLGGAGWNPLETLDDFRKQAEAFETGRVPLRDSDDRKALPLLLRSLRVLSEEEVLRIHVPLAALIGANDRFMSNVQRLYRVQPGMELTIIPNADHSTALSHPKFGEALLAFLLKHKATTR